MLKRQRPSTPPPSLADTTSRSDFPSEEFNQAAKRRRVVAPALNGQERGLQMDEEEWRYESDEELNNGPGAADRILNPEEQAGNYKHTNAMLYQLHLEHLRRFQTFAGGIQTAHHHGDTFQVSSFESSEKVTHKSALAQRPEGVLSPNVSHTEADVTEEASQVRARYENNNK